MSAVTISLRQQAKIRRLLFQEIRNKEIQAPLRTSQELKIFLDTLTRSEKVLMETLCDQFLSIEEAAQCLHVSFNVVRNRLSRIRAKYHFRNTLELCLVFDRARRIL